MIDSAAARRFRRLGTLTIFAVYFLILVGGIVRASGAGMGCPDWPTCFGQWVPPTHESQLPADYHSIYANRGYQNTEFNPVKTWTEYTNRLLGVSIGLLIVLTAWASRRYWHVDRVITYIAGGVVLLVGFQGWLGSAVVASNLKPLMITCHMLLALLIVSLLIAAIARSQRELLAMLTTGVLPHRYRRVLYVAMAMTLLQVTMGTQVRESIDLIAHHHNYIDRQYWRDSFPVIFYVHRSFSSLILFTNLWLGWQLIKLPAASAVLRRVATVLVACVLTAILAGVSLDRLGFPAVAQPIHLLMANVIFGCQFFLAICLHYCRRQSVQ